MSGSAGLAVSDRMKYGIKPSAVRSENYLHNIKATNGSNFNMQMGQDIIFEVPALGNGYYCDFSTSYFRFNVAVNLNAPVTATQCQANALANGYVRFERGPESMFRRVQYQDSSGNLLESFENYNDIYCLTELLTDNVSNRTNVSPFHGEGLTVAPLISSYESSIWTAAAISENPLQPASFTNNKYPPLRYPELGAAVIMLDDAGGNAANNAGAKTGAYDLGQYYNASGTATTLIAGGYAASAGNRYYSFQTLSALFGGSSDKYLPMSAINGMRIIFSCEDVKKAFVTNGLYSGAASATAPIISSVTLSDPTFFLNMVRVDPMVDAQLIQSATDRDGNIRIHSQTYQCFQYALASGQATWEQIIPIKVSSLKAIFFTFSPQSNSGAETFAREANAIALAAKNGTDRVMKTTWFQNNLNSYQFFIDGKPTPASPVYIRPGFSEQIAELQRALHFGHKCGDGQYLSLLGSSGVGGYQEQNFVLGQEFESFSNKGPVIESGMNTLNSLLSLRLFFNSGNSAEACYLKIFCLYDAFLTITPATGIMRTEL